MLFRHIRLVPHFIDGRKSTRQRRVAVIGVHTAAEVVAHVVDLNDNFARVRVKPDGMAPRRSTSRAISRCCHCRRAHQNSTARKISGSSCGKTGGLTASSNLTTTSSITAATPGTRRSTSPGKSCQSHAAIGQPSVIQSEDWYKYLPHIGDLPDSWLLSALTIMCARRSRSAQRSSSDILLLRSIGTSAITSP
jgi:hypothetical protein